MEEYSAYIQELRRKARNQQVHITVLQRANTANKKKIEELKKDIHKLKAEKEKLKQEVDKLKKEIEQLAKTKERYQVSLFDHGNFKKPDDTEKKPRGGQKGHSNTNRERQEDRSSYEHRRTHANTCDSCGKELTRVNAVKEKLLLDIVLNPQAVKVILEMERQWCSICQKEVLAQDPRSLPFTEYGINIFMMVLFLRFHCLLSLEKTGIVIGVLGIPLSGSVVNSITTQAKNYLGRKYEELVQAVRSGGLMYNDETGWMVRGKQAWIWVMANEDITVYKGAENRGKGLFEELYGDSHAQSMHDGYIAYQSITGEDKSLYCWAHMLRFSFEETYHDLPGSAGIQIRDKLVDIYQSTRGNPQRTDAEVRHEMEKALQITGEEASVIAIQKRLAKQKEGLIRALFHSPNGTNNYAEQELRPMAIMRYLSSGSDTYAGMETTATLMSVVRTQLKQPFQQFFPDMQSISA